MGSSSTETKFINPTVADWWFLEQLQQHFIIAPRSLSCRKMRQIDLRWSSTGFLAVELLFELHQIQNTGLKKTFFFFFFGVEYKEQSRSNLGRTVKAHNKAFYSLSEMRIVIFYLIEHFIRLIFDLDHSKHICLHIYSVSQRTFLLLSPIS